jgi:hypothetical protein
MGNCSILDCHRQPQNTCLMPVPRVPSRIKYGTWIGRDGGLAIIADGGSNRKLHLRHVSPWTALALGARQKDASSTPKKEKIAILRAK